MFTASSAEDGVFFAVLLTANRMVYFLQYYLLLIYVTFNMYLLSIIGHLAVLPRILVLLLLKTYYYTLFFITW